MLSLLSRECARARRARRSDPLAIVDMLTVGDAAPGEIAAQLGMPTNLVGIHVNVLHEAGLLVRGRSEGDRRRTYLRLVPESCPPWARPGSRRRSGWCSSAPTTPPDLSSPPPLWRDRVGGPVSSAGTHPAPRVHPRAVRVAHEHGLTLDPAGTHHVDDVVHDGDTVIAVCDNAHEQMTEG